MISVFGNAQLDNTETYDSVDNYVDGAEDSFTSADCFVKMGPVQKGSPSSHHDDSDRWMGAHHRAMMSPIDVRQESVKTSN